MASGNQQPKLRPGVDTPLFYLDAERKWRLASDGLQWIIQKRGPMQHKGRYAGQRRWKNVRFPTTPKHDWRGRRDPAPDAQTRCGHTAAGIRKSV